MRYEKVIRGKFMERPNRFVAEIAIEGKPVKAHVKNTGRCRELLVEGAEVILEDFRGRMGKRKLEYSVIGVEKVTPRGTMLVNMDSQAPNKAIGEALRSGRLRIGAMGRAVTVKGEYVYGGSRLDFYVNDAEGKEALVEVKGVTLEENGVAMFPDAPTERGVKHIRELMRAVEEGYSACIVFVIQMKGVKAFTPNDRTHSAFGRALREAAKAGVEIMAWDCAVREDSMELGEQVEVVL